MDFFEVVKTRRSIRKYKPDMVPKETVHKILEAARLAPSWKNTQCWRFILVDDATSKEKISDILTGNPCSKAVLQAPYVLVVCGYPDESGHSEGKPYYLADCAIAMEHILLAAAAEGLGTCFVGSFNEEQVREVLQIPADISVVGLTPLGYPDHEPKDRGRRPLEETLFHNSWGS